MWPKICYSLNKAIDQRQKPTFSGSKILDGEHQREVGKKKGDKKPEIVSVLDLAEKEIDELRKLWLYAVQTDSNAIGWLPSSVFTCRKNSNEITTVWRDGEMVGWCLRGVSAHRATLKIYQIWIRPDARVLEHGRALISQLEEICGRRRLSQIEAWVAEDLEANYFWWAVGFTRGVWRFGRGKSSRRIYSYTRQCQNLAVAIYNHPEFCEIDQWLMTNAQRRNCLNNGENWWKSNVH